MQRSRRTRWRYFRFGPFYFHVKPRIDATAEQYRDVMKEIYDRIGLDYHTYVTTINQEGKGGVEGDGVYQCMRYKV